MSTSGGADGRRARVDAAAARPAAGDPADSAADHDTAGSAVGRSPSGTAPAGSPTSARTSPPETLPDERPEDAPWPDDGADDDADDGADDDRRAWDDPARPSLAARTMHTEDELRTRLGLRPLGERLDPTLRLWGWLGPLAVTVLAGVLRLVDLTHPARLIFDETYYVKQAYSLLALGYEGEWAENADERFVAGDVSDLSTVADYVVHPTLGKWMIAAGLEWFGTDNGVGWRFSAAVVGTLSVLILARITMRLFGSPLLATMAGLLLALDGLHLTESRMSLLDIFLSFWVLVGFWFVLRDRSATRAVLAHRSAEEICSAGRLLDPWGPGVGARWWLVGAGVAFGLATGVKWSGIYAVAVLGLLVLAWDLAARRAVGAPLWVGAGVVRGGFPAFVALVPTAALTYVATWASWFADADSYRRRWAADLRAAGDAVPREWLPDSLNSWWEYHLAMWQFHTTLDSEHTYESHPAGWLIMWRPTSVYWPVPPPPPEACGADRCAEAILALGNPALWWLAALALPVLLYLAVRHRDWRAWTVLAGYLAMYAPWLTYSHRTIFTFYAVAFVPYVVLALVMVVGWASGLVRPPGGAPPRLRRYGSVVPTTVTLLVVAAAVYFWPVWTGATISHEDWYARMWLSSWV